MQIFWYDTIDSTNSEALRRLPELPSLCILAAHDQTAGRGQRGNSWFTEAGKNLTFSIVLKFGQNGIPPLAVKEAVGLNYLISDVVAKFLRGFGVDCQIKWPNDIYVQRRKISGVLIENTLNGEYLEASVIGAGININQREFPQLANATSLYRCIGQEQDLEEGLSRLCSLFEKELPLLFNPRQKAALFENYTSHLFQLGVPARYRDLLEDREFTGVIQGVEADGRLCIQDTEGQRRLYRFKEVGYIL